MGEFEDKRDAFLDAAEKLFRENGVMETTVNAIAKEMHVAKGLFYYYFDSKEEVIDAISKKYNRNFKKAMQNVMEGNDDFQERLNQFLKETIQSFRELYENFHVQGRDIDLSILSNKSFEEAKETASENLKALLNEGNATNVLHVPNPEKMAELIIGGIADLVSHAEVDLKEIQKVIQELIESVGKEQ